MASSELLFDDPCVLFALRRESGPLAREFLTRQNFPGAPCRARLFGRGPLSVLVLETGPGATATQAALAWLLGRPQLDNVAYRPKIVLSAGYAGALQADLHVGDVILAEDVAATGGQHWKPSWPQNDSQRELQTSLRRGRLLTAPRLVTLPEEKKGLGEAHAALAVDTESAAVAQACTEAGIPFGCVRAISDQLDTALSAELVELLAGARISPPRVALAVLRRPVILPELQRLAADSRIAADKLAKVLRALLMTTLRFAAEV
jgi:hypothetical protein